MKDVDIFKNIAKIYNLKTKVLNKIISTNQTLTTTQSTLAVTFHFFALWKT